MTIQQLAFDGRTRLQVMVDAAIERLRMFCPPEGYYLAFSGGKDSQCIYHLAQEAGVKFDAHYNITGIDPPELVYHIQRNYPDVKREPYEKSMWQLIKEHGMPPTRVVRFCCATLKERGGAGRITVTGVRAAESVKRSMNWGVVTHQGKRAPDGGYLFTFDPEQGQRMVRSCSAKGKIIVAPVFDWQDDDVWAYIRDRKIQYCSLYDEGFERLGCIGCPLVNTEQRERELARWPKFREAYLRTFDSMLRARAGREAFDAPKHDWKTPEEVFNWWING